MTSTRASEDLLTGRLRDVVLASTLGGVVGVVGGLASVLVGMWDDSIWWLEPVVHDLGPWTALSLVVGFTFRRDLPVAVWGGLVTQVALTLGYAAGYAQRHDWLTFGRAFSIEDLLLALVAGPVFGAVGALLRDPQERTRILCLAAAGAPWLADVLRDLVAVLDRAHRAAMTAFISFAVGQYLTRAFARSRLEWQASLPLAGMAAVAVGALLYLL